jgi:hypothetical protein
MSETAQDVWLYPTNVLMARNLRIDYPCIFQLAGHLPHFRGDFRQITLNRLPWTKIEPRL